MWLLLYFMECCLIKPNLVHTTVYVFQKENILWRSFANSPAQPYESIKGVVCGGKHHPDEGGYYPAPRIYPILYPSPRFRNIIFRSVNKRQLGPNGCATLSVVSPEFTGTTGMAVVNK